MLASPHGVDVRVARDPGVLSPGPVFDAMKADGWDLIASAEAMKLGDRQFHRADMKKNQTRLMLLLLDQPDKTTLVIYATHEANFGDSQRGDVAAILKQLAAVKNEPAP